jgi:multiple sugar transport system substrate-binding protein
MLKFYAKESFDKAGIAYPKEGWTYQEFQDLAVKLTRPSAQESASASRRYLRDAVGV